MTYPKSSTVYDEPGSGWTIAGAKMAAMATHGQGPGTESNRARAARGGGQTWEDAPRWPAGNVVTVRVGDRDVRVTVEAGETEEQAIARAQQLAGLGEHERAVGIDHASGPDFTMRMRMTVCEDADGVRRWKAVDDRRPTSAAWSGAVPGPVVSLPSTLAEAERLYGKGSPVWEAVRACDLAGVTPTAAPQPDPAPGQVWLPPVGLAATIGPDADGTLTIASVPKGGVAEFGVGAHGHRRAADLGWFAQRPDHGGWTCVGVATPHGRVMVGDGWRRAPDHEFTVTAIASEDGEPWIKVRYAGGQQDHDFDARNLWDCDGYERTRYAPARAGERYRHRTERRTVQIVPDRQWMLLREEDSSDLYALRAGGGLDPTQWERLDPGAALPTHDRSAEHRRLDAYYQAQEDAEDALRFECRTCGKPIEYEGACSKKCANGGAPPYTYGRRPGSTITAYEHAAAEFAKRDCVLSVGADVWTIGAPATPTPNEPIKFNFVVKGADEAGKAFQRIEAAAKAAVTAPSRLTLQAPARDLRALFDAIGRVLESAGPHHTPFAGYIVRVQRDEMLFAPEVSTGTGASIRADTKHLRALRRAVIDAMANGAAYRLEWGKGQTLSVTREGPPLAAPASEPADTTPTRYAPSEGGAQGWRWEVGE